MGFLFAAHRNGALLGAIPQSSFLDHASAALDHFNLAIDLVVDSLLHETERVDVLQLRAYAEPAGPFEAYRNIGIAPQAAFLHVAVANVQVFQDLLQAGKIFVSLRRAAEVRRRHDLDQGDAAPVDIQVRDAIGIG